MARTHMDPKLIWVRYRSLQSGRLMTISDELPGLAAVGETRNELRTRLPEILVGMEAAAGRACQVSVHGYGMAGGDADVFEIHATEGRTAGQTYAAA